MVEGGVVAECGARVGTERFAPKGEVGLSDLIVSAALYDEEGDGESRGAGGGVVAFEVVPIGVGSGGAEHGELLCDGGTVRCAAAEGGEVAELDVHEGEYVAGGGGEEDGSGEAAWGAGDDAGEHLSAEAVAGDEDFCCVYHGQGCGEVYGGEGVVDGLIVGGNGYGVGHGAVDECALVVAYGGYATAGEAVGYVAEGLVGAGGAVAVLRP